MEQLTLPLVVSGDSPEALAAAAERLREELGSTSSESLAELAYRRLAMDHAKLRGAVIATTPAELVRGLAVLARGRTARNVIRGVADVAQRPVLVFPGLGMTWPGMTAELLTVSPEFRERLHGYGDALRSQFAWNPAAALVAGEDFARLGKSQPALFAITSALADLWRAFGLREKAVVGHSIGEMAAAHAGGYLTTENAAQLIGLWVRALTPIEGRGAMASLAAPVDRVGQLLGRWRGRLYIAAFNSPTSVTVSGDTDAVEELLADLEREGVWGWKVPGGDVAGHSPNVEFLREMVLEQAPRAPSGSPRSAFYSAVSGSRLKVADLTSEYWYRTLREPVLFEKAVRALIEDGHRLFIEVSAHPVLTTVIEETLHSAGVTGAAIATLDRRKSDTLSLVHALTRAFVNGATIDWEMVRARFFSQPEGTATPSRQEESHIKSATLPREVATTALSQTGPIDESLDRAALLLRPASEQRELLLNLIAREAGAVLEHGISASTQTFHDIGFTSLTLVEFAKALSTATGLDLPTTLVFDHPTPLALMEHLRRALGLESTGEPAQGITESARRRAEEPIAIVGIGCRYPGGVASPESLWHLVLAGRDAVDDYPADRGWDKSALYDPTPGRLGKMYQRAGGFLHDATRFDAAFFGISPREATAMEPQQRLLLEVAWEAIERAGIDPATLHGSGTGVFAGIMAQEYGPPLQQGSDDVAGYRYMGTAGCVASGRIAYVLGLEGPTITVDTACSSSLVAIHLACDALRSHDCTLALAGGATVMSTPGVLVDFSRQQALAPDGRCKAFSASADGVGLAEGVGMLLLERLSQAQSNGHPILAVIPGSAINQDGASNGLTAPSGAAQQRVIRRALSNAGLNPQDIDVVEAHGTGTRLGDPVEAHALLATYGHQRPADRPLLLGSIKSNFGHTQAAAGVAGLIKMVMAIHHGLVPRSLHVDAPSTEVNWSTGAIQLVTERQPWPDVDGRPRRAAVSSFGVSGTNGHLIVEQAPSALSSTSRLNRDAADDEDSARKVLWPISAKTETALRAQATRLAAQVVSQPHLDPADVGYSLGASRSRFPCRALVWGGSRDDLLEALQAFAGHRDHPRLAHGREPSGEASKLVFVFPGQGAQWPRMGMALYDVFSVYRRTLDEVDGALRMFTDWSVVDVLRGARGAPSLGRVEVVQPALFAVMTCLARLWQSFGLFPDAVIGHSVGEIAAAHLAGALTLDDAAKLVVLRSRSLLALHGTGAMATIGLPEERARALVDRYRGDIGLAVFNSPRSTVVSGDPGAIDDLLRRCEAEGVHAKRIAVDVTAHSPQLAPLRPGLREQLDGITPNPTVIAFYSSVDGYPHATPLSGMALDAEYWCDNLCKPVRFVDSIRSLAGHGNVTFLECSPQPILVPAIEETVASGTLVVGTLQRTKPSNECLAQAMARLYVNGHNPDWRAMYPAATIVDVPTYPFEGGRYWLAPQPSSDVAAAGQRTTGHALLGAAIDLPDDGGLLLTGCIALATRPWLADHGAAGVVLVPGTAFIDMVLQAASLAGSASIAELTLHAPMLLPDQGALDVQLKVDPGDDEGHRAVTLHARKHTTDGLEVPAWALHATARLTRGAPEPPPAVAPTPWPPADAEPLDLAGLRARLAGAGYNYGPAFNGLRSVWRQGDRLHAEAHLPGDLVPAGHTIHPALLDAVLHPIALADAAGDAGGGRAGLRLPYSFHGITVFGTPTKQLRAQLQLTKPDTVSVMAFDESGAPALTIDALTLRETTSDHLRRLLRVKPDHDLLHMTWSPLSSAVTGTGDLRRVDDWALLDTDPQVTAAIGTIPRHAGLPELTAAIRSGIPTPEVVIWPLPPSAPEAVEDVPGTARMLCKNVVQFLQAWLADDQLSRTLLVAMTRRAVVTDSHESPDLAHGPAWALLHTAQNENPGRFVLVDADHAAHARALLTSALASGHSQLAVRSGQLYVPHLARAAAAQMLTPPLDTPHWRLDIANGDGLDNLALAPAPEAAAPLRSGQVRIDVHAAGLNFYDTARALGLIPPQHAFGAEAAGVVSEVGPGVDRYAVGNRVMALTEGAFGPSVVADDRMTAPLLDEWSFAQAASVPVAFVTAYYALVELANVRPGERVLIHAAAGGVGQAAIQLARHLGAELFATAHPNKWDTLRRLGFADDHIASSRTLDFAERFRATTDGRGMDVVLNSLSGSFIDASMDLMAPGGRFVEIGKTDVRDEKQVAATYPNVSYRYLDWRVHSGFDHTSQILTDLLHLFRMGVLTPLPVTAYGIRDATRAFRLMQHARHTGKIVLTLPRPLDPDGTVLITGGTGVLGSLLAHHLISAHRARHLVLASRSGPSAVNAPQLKADLESQGATVTIVSCDVSAPCALKQVLDSIPPEHPLTGVFHTAGVLADATIPNLTSDHFDKVFAPKVDAAWHLHELTQHLDLAAFVLYSSINGALGNAGQGNYAAANTFLDGLAHHRRRLGLPATSLGWGWWRPLTNLSRAFTETDNARIARTGFSPITVEHGHLMLDAALELPYPVLAASPFDQHTLRENSELGTLHPLLERLAGSTTVRPRARATADKASELRRQLVGLAPAARLKHLQTIIATHAATILGLGDATRIVPDQTFKAAGFDSLMALELRNRLNGALGLRLPATLIFDFPTPVALSAYLGDQLFPHPAEDQKAAPEDSRIRQALESIPLARLREFGLLDTLLRLAEISTDSAGDIGENDVESIRSASVDELVLLASGADRE